jgi:hypothetical protein
MVAVRSGRSHQNAVYGKKNVSRECVSDGLVQNTRGWDWIKWLFVLTTSTTSLYRSDSIYLSHVLFLCVNNTWTTTTTTTTCVEGEVGKAKYLPLDTSLDDFDNDDACVDRSLLCVCVRVSIFVSMEHTTCASGTVPLLTYGGFVIHPSFLFSREGQEKGQRPPKPFWRKSLICVCVCVCVWEIIDCGTVCLTK